MSCRSRLLVSLSKERVAMSYMTKGYEHFSGKRNERGSEWGEHCRGILHFMKRPYVHHYAVICKCMFLALYFDHQVYLLIVH